MGTSLGASSPGAPAGGVPGELKWGGILRGTVVMLFGVVVLAWPSITLRVLFVAFGVFVIAAGILAILEGLRTKHARDRWLQLGEGVVAILAGIAAFVWPGATTFVLSYIIAAWAMVTGVMEMAGAFQTRLVALPEWLLLASGVLSILFGIVLLVWPYIGAPALVWLIGIYAILSGILHLVLVFTRGSVRRVAAV